MNKFQKSTAVILGTIAIAGVLGIPLGNPKFIDQAVVLEFCSIALSIMTWRNFRYVYIPNFVIAGIVIAGNTAFYKHIEIMTTFHPLYNAIILITGGYVLQGLLLITNYLAHRENKRFTMSHTKA